MNSILVILLTAMAVLGAYYLADLLTQGLGRPHAQDALLVLPQPVSMAQALDVAAAVRGVLPHCEVIACLADAAALPPASGLRGVQFAAAEELGAAVVRALDLQTGAGEL